MEEVNTDDTGTAATDATDTANLSGDQAAPNTDL